ncbi:TPA: hypothetical protein QB621_001629 [Pasteurella multocida]|uniref:hypothetical protein n=1 Tax=Pasteurella multocida TaxID=747 RepID=UPI0007ED55CE|nr:hypothetical protein [Pasteurella multocida]AWY03346.1 hypothetical protein [Pasteurella phage Pm86]MCL7822583.1 hypothetical protein [Pasteurella multocida]MDY0633761.1 hypothetical protein [Pasteurella multocida]MDY0692502.1 hypothetical protein [Pasteurella multocida]MEB3501767.1 hypothetical protein [Pasteurella multocida]
MKTLNTNLFTLEHITANTFKVYRKHYDTGLTTEYSEIKLSDEVIAGLEKKPHSGYWSEVVRQTVEQNGALYEKHKI